MPRIRRERTIDAPAQELWELVADPHHLPRWWPAVQRVEDASPDAWTKVLASPRGRSVRADFTRLHADAPRSLSWRQEIEESPFERILSEAVTELSLEPVDAGSTRVALQSRQRLRGMARLGAVMVRRATARQLEGALDGLEQVAGR